MFKRLFVVALFIVLSVTILPEVAKADAYEYENINELADSVASVINKKNSYTFKYKFNRPDFYFDLDVTVNWKAKIVTFNGFIYRLETAFEKEKFYAVINLKNNKVKTESKAYKKGRNILSLLISVWYCEKEDDHAKSLGHYLLNIFMAIGKDTTVDESENSKVIKKVLEKNDVTYNSTVITDKSKVLEMDLYSSNNVIRIKIKK